MNERDTGRRTVVKLDEDSAVWRASARRMVLAEDRLFRSDKQYFTGSYRWVRRLHMHYSRCIFPGGEINA